MKNLELFSKLRELLIKNGKAVSAIEMTSGNYDDRGGSIEGEIPTITTELCEIGAYDKTCYFTIILKSNQLTKKLFDLISEKPGVQIYGLRNFMENYYPKERFQYEEFERQVNSEEFFQVQFNFDGNEMSTKDIWRKYLEVEPLFGGAGVKVENQLVKNFKAE